MKRPPRSFILLVLLALLGALLYLGYSLRFGFVGFPLDDAWIHQTYARNLALHHQLAYNPGQPSVGSTSPLWSVLVTPAYVLPLEYRFWTYLLGAILLALTGWITYRLASALFPEDSLTPILAGAFCVLEWHLAWAAFSGMETVLFVFLSILAIERYVADGRPFLIGVVTGLLTLTRPEGVLLLALLILDTLLRRKRTRDTLTWAQAVTSAGFLLLGFLVLIIPYLIVNLTVTGNLFPNTFYAKQAEYRDLIAAVPLWIRWAQMAAVTAVGAQVLLIPGYVYAVYGTVRLRRWDAILPLAWWFALLSAYAIRLPVTYQHGRYLIPAIPILIVYGVWGTKNLPGVPRIVRRVLFTSIPVLLVIFWVRGAEQYAIDVRIIDSELRETGQWIKANTPPQAVIGAHDIGAIGYFSGRVLVDTAGLITPEVVPFIRDEATMLAFLEDEEADYIVIFPSWYPEMSESPKLRAIYRSDSPWIVEAGGDNIVVYETVWNE
jgi:arabinofuranosyltransferase